MIVHTSCLTTVGCPPTQATGPRCRHCRLCLMRRRPLGLPTPRGGAKLRHTHPDDQIAAASGRASGDTDEDEGGRTSRRGGAEKNSREARASASVSRRHGHHLLSNGSIDTSAQSAFQQELSSSASGSTDRTLGALLRLFAFNIEPEVSIFFLTSVCPPLSAWTKSGGHGVGSSRIASHRRRAGTPR